VGPSWSWDGAVSVVPDNSGAESEPVAVTGTTADSSVNPTGGASSVALSTLGQASDGGVLNGTGNHSQILAHKNVLVVDDAKMNRKMLTRLLTRAGARLTEAEDGIQALLKFDEAVAAGVTIDLVMTDYQMPRMDGPTAIRAMRARGYSGPIVGVTGNVLEEDKNVMITAGANTVIEKPFDIDLFCDWYAMYVST